MKRRRKGIRTKTIIFSCTLTRTNTINSTFTRILNCSSQKSYTDISFMGIMLSLQNTFVLLRFILSKYVLHMCVCVSVFAYPKVKTRKKNEKTNSEFYETQFRFEQNLAHPTHNGAQHKYTTRVPTSNSFIYDILCALLWIRLWLL